MFKFFIYPRLGYRINYEEMQENFHKTINDFITNPNSLKIEYNFKTNTNDLSDINNELSSFKANGVKFMKEHFIEITETNFIPFKTDDISSSNIRKVLAKYDFNITEDYKNKQLANINPNIKTYILTKKLYENGEQCEGVDKFKINKQNLLLNNELFEEKIIK
jgi:hypothetical protein